MFDLTLALKGLLGLTLALNIGLLFLGLLILFPTIKKIYSRLKIENSICQLGKYQLKNIILDDGIEGKVFIERLLLTPDGFMILVKNWREGYIFGSEHMDQWAQIINSSTYHFKNPLYALTHSVAALKHHAPNMPASTKILFTADCSFPKGQPKSALLPRDIFNLKKITKEKLQQTPVSQEFEQAWSIIKSHSDKAEKSLVFEEKIKLGAARIFTAFTLIALGVYFLYRLLL